MSKYRIELEDDGKSRDERVITASDLDDAIAQAEDYAWDWVHDGEWGNDDIDVPVYYRIYDASTGEHLHRDWIDIRVSSQGGNHE